MIRENNNLLYKSGGASGAFVSGLLLSLFFISLQFGLVGIAQAEQSADKAGLVDYEIVDLIESKSIPKSLTGKQGDAKRGEALMVNRKKGNCIACHSLDDFEKKAVKDPNKYGDMGEVGPPLDGVASRYKEGQLRLLLVNAKKVFPETIMPAFYRIDGLTRVGGEFRNKPILEAQEIEDIVRFLMGLE